MLQMLDCHIHTTFMAFYASCGCNIWLHAHAHMASCC